MLGISIARSRWLCKEKEKKRNHHVESWCVRLIAEAHAIFGILVGLDSRHVVVGLVIRSKNFFGWYKNYSGRLVVGKVGGAGLRGESFVDKSRKKKLQTPCSKMLDNPMPCQAEEENQNQLFNRMRDDAHSHESS